MSPDEPIHRLEELARTAAVQARQDYGLILNPEELEPVDRILRAEAVRSDPQRRELLAAVYGAWLGEVARSRWPAKWVGLSEPVAPRLNVAGLLISPIDAVRRRLESPATETFVALFQQLEAWIQGQKAAQADALSVNRDAWNRLSTDARYAGEGELPPDAPAAREAIDEWLRNEVDGKDLLCLGAGGGRQGPLHAIAGARVTVVALSEQQLEHDRRAAESRWLAVRTLAASLDDLSALEAASFDVVLQPVSACYVPDVEKVYAQVARVLRRGGLYVVQHKHPASLQGSSEPMAGGYLLARPDIEGSALPPEPKAPHRDGDSVEFIHSLDSLLGGLCRAGFTIEDYREPPRADAWAPAGSAAHRASYLPPYLKIKARRV